MALKVDPTLREKLAIIKTSFDALGFWMTLRYVVVYLLSYKPVSDRSFDRRHRTDTAGYMLTENLGIADKEAEKKAVPYVPSPPRVTRHILRSLDLDRGNYSFVDFGCGKGRVCLVASEFPFRKVIGVEISAALHKIANENLSHYRNSKQRCSDIEFRCGDARQLQLPEGDTVFHFYHPFGHDILRQVLKSIELSLRDGPRRILIAYLFINKPAQDVIGEFGFLRAVREVQVANVQYNWSLYSNDVSR